jgi:hypothetical protein
MPDMVVLSPMTQATSGALALYSSQVLSLLNIVPLAVKAILYKASNAVTSIL